MRNSEKVKKWRKTTKQRIVDSMGGECQCCGYKKCNAALEVHHINPEEKEIQMGRIMAHPVAWKRIAAELTKCILICSNCHKEVHAGIRSLPEKFAKFDESYLEYKTLKNDLELCPVCEKKKKLRENKTCSRTCAAKLKGSITWDDEIFTTMFHSGSTYEEIGDYFKCSTGAVSKKVKKLQLKR